MCLRHGTCRVVCLILHEQELRGKRLPSLWRTRRDAAACLDLPGGLSFHGFRQDQTGHQIARVYLTLSLPTFSISCWNRGMISSLADRFDHRIALLSISLASGTPTSTPRAFVNEDEPIWLTSLASYPVCQLRHLPAIVPRSNRVGPSGWAGLQRKDATLDR